MSRLMVAALLSLPVALAACGDDDSETTVTEAVPAETGAAETGPTATETEATATEISSGPQGPLTPDGIGEVERGMSTDQVSGLFGEPTRTATAPGCELAPNSPDVLTWTYRLAEGRVFLRFDAASGELGSYRNTSPSLDTTAGDRVGDPFSSLRANWGSSLKRLNLGAKATAQLGFWTVKQGPQSELLFDIEGGTINSISGGRIEICE